MNGILLTGNLKKYLRVLRIINQRLLTFDNAVVFRFFFWGVFWVFMALLFTFGFALEVVSYTEEARLSLGGSWGGGGVAVSTLECLGGGNGGGAASSSFSSSVSSIFVLFSSISRTISISTSSSTILLDWKVGRLIMDDRFLAGSGGGFICPGVDGLDVEVSDNETKGPNDVTVVTGLETDADGIGGGVRRPGRIVECGRFVFCFTMKYKKRWNNKTKIITAWPKNPISTPEGLTISTI